MMIFIAGLFVGAFSGIFVLALCQAAGRPMPEQQHQKGDTPC